MGNIGLFPSPVYSRNLSKHPGHGCATICASPFKFVGKPVDLSGFEGLKLHHSTHLTVIAREFRSQLVSGLEAAAQCLQFLHEVARNYARRCMYQTRCWARSISFRYASHRADVQDSTHSDVLRFYIFVQQSYHQLRITFVRKH